MNPIPMDRWGRDHWSTFAYAETCAVDHSGFLDMRRLRMDGKQYPSYLAFSETLADHNDLDCLKDAQAAGLLTIERATQRDRKGEIKQLTYAVAFTPLGLRVAGALRSHKAAGGSFGDFHMVPAPV